MSPAQSNDAALVGRAIAKNFPRDGGGVVRALGEVYFTVKRGTLAALVGPDGAGKTTLLRLATGLLPLDGGALEVLGFDLSASPQPVQDRIGYMPQKFGLYEDLTVQENLDLYADLHGIGQSQRREFYPRLMDMTALGPFTARLAGKLSGGMKQKLGLACTLVSAPELLLLDEPTVGVDPLSRRELWQIIGQLVREQQLTVLLSTAYLDEAERCDHVIVLHQGKILVQGAPKEVSELAAQRSFVATPPAAEKARDFQARLLGDASIVDAVPIGGQVRLVMAEDGVGLPLDHLGAELVAVSPRFEDGFMILLHREIAAPPRNQQLATLAPRASIDHDGPAVEVRDLVRRFGSFVAVDRVNFQVARGEIFGLLGPNGAGKTTTFRMLCGLLPASSGTLRVAGADLRRARAPARQRIGYVAQKFSLYGHLSVVENLDFFASAYGLRGAAKRARLDWALAEFDLAEFTAVAAGTLPGGYKQRLAMAAALLHEPELLFLDEPTSGADPLARREFWRRITVMAQTGVTVVVTTHFMEEAEYCDRIAILDAGRVLAQGTPAQIRAYGPATTGAAATMEDAFVAIVESGREGARGAA